MVGTGLVAFAKKKLSHFLHGDIEYKPSVMIKPPRLVNTPGGMAWYGIELIIEDILLFTKCERRCALEFGVQYGYSTAVFANYFESVTGVDLFEGDEHAGYDPTTLQKASETLRDFTNIKLVKADFKDYIIKENRIFDLIHIDIVHTYEDTYNCGQWACKHANLVLFHDTESFPEVKRAVSRLARENGFSFYNYYPCHGLGILQKNQT